jgi:sugar phosphate isomerase/epimerase
MRVQRFLAAAWLSVHGPHDPRRLLIAALETQFAGIAASPTPRPIDWPAVRAAAEDLPIEFAAVRANNPLAEHSATAAFAAMKDGERNVALGAIRHAVSIARQLGCPQVVLDPGVVPVMGDIEAEDLGDPQYDWTETRTQALLARRKVGRNGAVDRVCRELFGLARSFPDIAFSLTQSRSLRAVADVAALQDVFEDLSHHNIGYWHDAAICARREQVVGEPQGEWLERFGSRCRGLSLGDASADGLYLPPGAGGVDYPLLASYLPRLGARLPGVVELDSSVAPGELPSIRACLDKHGL